MKGVGTRLRKRAEELDLSDAEVARQSGLQVRTYGHYVNDKREPDYAALRRICTTLKTHPDYVLGVVPHPDLSGTEIAPGQSPDQLPAYGGALGAGLVEIGKTSFASIARYDASLSAGPGCILDPQAEPLGYQLLEASWLQTVTRAAPEGLALLRVDGDSMEDTLFDNDWVLIDRTQRRMSRQGIYALAVGETAWIKRLTLDLVHKKIQVISDNPKYPLQTLAEDELHIIGRHLALIWRKSTA